MKKRILGIDPGIAILGFGTIVGHRVNIRPGITPQESLKSTPEALQVVDFGIIETPSNRPIGERLAMIYDDLQGLIAEVQPDLVAIEQFFFYRMSNTIMVAQARGVILLVLAQAQLPYVEFTPAQVKQALTGYGNADKGEVQSAVARELNLAKIPQPNDAADALAIALTAWYNL